MSGESPETVADVIDYEEILLRNNELSSRVFFVATVDDQVVGWVHLDLPETEKLEHTAKLTVGVLEEYQREGIGGTLLEKGMSWARENDFEKLYNSVPAINEEAMAFLENHGWHTEAAREDHYYIGDEYVDEVMMAASLTSADGGGSVERGRSADGGRSADRGGSDADAEGRTRTRRTATATRPPAPPSAPRRRRPAGSTRGHTPDRRSCPPPTGRGAERRPRDDTPVRHTYPVPRRAPYRPSAPDTLHRFPDE